MHFALTLAVLVYAPTQGGAQRDLVEAAKQIKDAARMRLHTVVEGAIERAEAELARGLVPRERLAFFTKAHRLMEEGRTALERVDLERAEMLLGRAIALYEPELARAGVPLLLAEAALFRGVALFELGRTAEAAALFRRARACDSTAELTEVQVRPDVARAFAQAVSDEKAPTVSVSSSVEREEMRGSLEALRQAPSTRGLNLLFDLLGVDEVMVVALGRDEGLLTLVGSQMRSGVLDEGGHCMTALRTVTVGAAGIASAAELLVDELTLAAPTCGAREASAVVDADPIAHPRPSPPPSPPPRRIAKRRFWEQPWLWMGLLAAGSVAAGVLATTLSSEPSYLLKVDARGFSLRESARGLLAR